MQYTLVQHSGYGVAGDPHFRHAVEEHLVSTAAEREKVQKVGGLLFPDYAAAAEAMMRVNYPPGFDGHLVPHVNGTFSDLRLDGLAIYVPTEDEHQT